MSWFDFNRDGKTSINEQWIAYNIFKECTGGNDEDNICLLGGEDNSWRDNCEDGIEFDVDPEDYETEEEYAEALEEAKYAWRDDCEDGIEFDVNPEDYETEEEYAEALDEAKHDAKEKTETVKEYDYSKEKYYWRRKYFRTETYGLNIRDFENERDFRQALVKVREEALKIAMSDKTIYHYCAVVYEGNPYPYHYRTEDASLKIGDKVIVPVGSDNREVVAVVVSVEQHTRLSVPYPVEKVKCIIGKQES